MGNYGSLEVKPLDLLYKERVASKLLVGDLNLVIGRMES